MDYVELSFKLELKEKGKSKFHKKKNSLIF